VSPAPRPLTPRFASPGSTLESFQSLRQGSGTLFPGAFLTPRLVLVAALTVVASCLGMPLHAEARDGDGSGANTTRSDLRREHWSNGMAMAAAGYGPVGGDAQLSREVLAEMNLMRSDPQAYIEVLRDYRDQFQGDIVVRPGRINIQTREGVAAVDEAIAFLRRQKAMEPLTPDLILALTAGDHVADQGPSGFIGHYGSDGWDFATRVARRGGDPYGGENISYGYDTAREVIIQLLVDDNIADRGHRVNLFRDGYVRAGVSCGPHAVFNHMCVIDYGYEPMKRR
jgi:uncharacterized protein YkwD